MDTIYNLQQRAETLRKKTETESITPEMVGGLHADTLDYLVDMEQNLDGTGVHRVYKTYAAMTAEGEAPTGTNGKALRYGQLVAVYDADSTQAENGNIYAWQGGTGESAWLLMGNNLTNMTAVENALSQEAAARTAADTALQAAIDKTDLAMANAQTSIGKQISAVETRMGTAEGKVTATETKLNTLQTTVEGYKIPDLQTKVNDISEDIGSIHGWQEDVEESQAEQQELQTADGVVNVNTLLGHSLSPVSITFAQLLVEAWNSEYDIKHPGVILTWLTADGWRSKQWVASGKQTEADWTNESNWQDFGGARQIFLTQSEYDAMAEAGTLEDDVYYNVLEE